MPANQRIELQERDRRIINHVYRYRLTTQETLKCLFFPDQDEEAVKAVVRRLRIGGYLRARSLYKRRKYYQLTTRVAHVFGWPDEIAKVLGRETLPRRYAVLAFCCHGETRRQRYTPEQLTERFPELVQAGVAIYHHDYYLDTDDAGQKRLARILVDLGGDYQSFVRKCVKALRTAAHTSGLSDLLAEHRFQLTILTAEPLKQARITDSLASHHLSARCVVEVIPDLGELLQPGLLAPPLQGAPLQGAGTGVSSAGVSSAGENDAA